MKILLVNPNSYCFRGTLCPPLAVMAVAAVAREAGHEVRIVDRNIESFFQRTLMAFSPDVVGVSVFTGPLIRDALYVTKLVKKVYGQKVKTVWGGIHPTLLPRQTLENDAIDFVVQGEEFAIIGLLRELEGNGHFENVEGLGYKDRDGTIHINDLPELCANLDSLPPLPWDLVRSQEYFRIEIVLVTSRGCPYNCKFCYNKKVHQRKWRAMSAERVLSEIHSVEALTPTRILKFHDDNFAVNEKRLHAILDQLSSNYTLYIEMRTNRITREFLESIKRFKRVWFFFGIESGSQRLLDEMAKGIKLDDHRKAMALIDQYPNFCTSGNAIVGLPGETQEEFEQTVDFTFDLKMTWGNISLFCPYPGSEYYEDVLSEGRIKVPTQLEEWADWGFYFNEQIASWFEWDYIGQKGRNYLKQLDRKNFRLAFLRMVKKGEFHKMGRRLLDYKPMLHATLQKIERRVFSA